MAALALSCHTQPQMFKELAKPPEKLNKTRGIGIIAAAPDLVADVITHDYEKWDDNIRGFRTLSEENDAESGAVAETSWSRYGLGAPAAPGLPLVETHPAECREGRLAPARG